MRPLPPELLDPTTLPFAELLAAYFHDCEPANEIAVAHGLSLAQFIAWRDSPQAAKAIDQITRFERQRATDLAARAIATAVQNLANHLLADITSERARKAATTLARLVFRPASTRSSPSPAPDPPASTVTTTTSPSPDTRCLDASCLDAFPKVIESNPPADTTPQTTPTPPDSTDSAPAEAPISAPTFDSAPSKDRPSHPTRSPPHTPTPPTPNAHPPPPTLPLDGRWEGSVPCTFAR